MADQAHYWSEAARRYEYEFVDPYEWMRDKADPEVIARDSFACLRRELDAALAR